MVFELKALQGSLIHRFRGFGVLGGLMVRRLLEAVGFHSAFEALESWA